MEELKSSRIGAWAAPLAGFVSLCAVALSRLSTRFPELDPLADSVPLWAGVAMFGLVLTARRRVWTPRLSRRRIASALLNAAGMIAAAVTFVPDWVRPDVLLAQPGQQRSIRLIQINIWDANPDPDTSLDWIVRQKPDIVAMQEVTPAVNIGMLKRGFSVGRDRAAVTIFTRLPFTGRRDDIDSSHWTAPPPVVREGIEEPATGRVFYVFALHLSHPERRRTAGEIDAFFDLLTHYDRDRLIVVGDLNRSPWSALLQRFDRRLGLFRLDHAEPTWPSAVRIGSRYLPAVPLIPIDHVYVGPAWRVVKFETGPAMGSDHRPLIVDLALAP